MRSELLPEYDSRRSFYGKAIVFSFGPFMELRSYGHLVARYDRDCRSLELLPKWDYSSTTLRHVKEFMRQLGYPAMTKSEIAEHIKEGM